VVDPLLAASEMVLAIQHIGSRSVDPLAQAVVSVTNFHAGTADNITPETAILRTGRCVQARPHWLGRPVRSTSVMWNETIAGIYLAVLHKMGRTDIKSFGEDYAKSNSTPVVL
jgi:hypothetical protein